MLVCIIHVFHIIHVYVMLVYVIHVVYTIHVYILLVYTIHVYILLVYIIYVVYIIHVYMKRLSILFCLCFPAGVCGDDHTARTEGKPRSLYHSPVFRCSADLF
jgi:hypothetical protein